MAGGRMPILLTTEMLAHAYDYLACQPPFDRWNLQPSEDIQFFVIKRRDRVAHYQLLKGKHSIAMSSKFVGRHETLLSSMAHEMIHLHMAQTCWNRRNPHDATFHAYADAICAHHDFDRLLF